MSLLIFLDMAQSVDIPTHQHGHTLDLKILHGPPIFISEISNIFLSEHFPVIFKFTAPLLPSLVPQHFSVPPSHPPHLDIFELLSGTQFFIFRISYLFLHSQRSLSSRSIPPDQGFCKPLQPFKVRHQTICVLLVPLLPGSFVSYKYSSPLFQVNHCCSKLAGKYQGIISVPFFVPDIACWSSAGPPELMEHSTKYPTSSSASLCWRTSE